MPAHITATCPNCHEEVDVEVDLKVAMSTTDAGRFVHVTPGALTYSHECPPELTPAEVARVCDMLKRVDNPTTTAQTISVNVIAAEERLNRAREQERAARNR